MSVDAMTPAPVQKKARLLLGQGLHLMGEPNPRVQLWRTLQAFIQPRHPQEYQAKPPFIIEIADLLQSGIFEAIGFIDNQQFDEMRRAARHQEVALARLALIRSLHQIREGGEQCQYLPFDARRRSSHWSRIEHRSALQQRHSRLGSSKGERFVRIKLIDGAAPGEGNQGFWQEGFDLLPLRVIPGRLGLSCAWRSIGQPDGAGSPTGFTHLGEAAVGFGDYEGRRLTLVWLTH